MKKESYGRVVKKIRINKGENPGNLDIIIPNIETEIKGRVVGANNLPLANQAVELTSHQYCVRAVTDETGHFTLKHLEPGNISLLFEYNKDGKFIRYNRFGEFDLNLKESIWLEVTVDDNLFKYQLSRTSYPNL